MNSAIVNSIIFRVFVYFSIQLLFRILDPWPPLPRTYAHNWKKFSFSRYWLLFLSKTQFWAFFELLKTVKLRPTPRKNWKKLWKLYSLKQHKSVEKIHIQRSLPLSVTEILSFLLSISFPLFRRNAKCWKSHFVHSYPEIPFESSQELCGGAMGLKKQNAKKTIFRSPTECTS